MKFKHVMAEIEAAVPEGGNWCSVEKARTLASLIVGMRPKIVVELGVWMGGSAIPMAIALRSLGTGQLVAIDSWSRDVSVAGQEDQNLKWWGETVGEGGHEHAFRTFVARLEKHGIPSERCKALRQRSDEAVVPSVIDILHHDANHGPQAVLDIERWTPAIRVGGFLILDDLNWPGEDAPPEARHVQRARDRAIELGFVELYPLGTGCVMQRLRAESYRADGAHPA